MLVLLNCLKKMNVQLPLDLTVGVVTLKLNLELSEYSSEVP